MKSTRKHLQHSNDSEIYKIFRESCFIKNLRTTVSYFFPVHIEREKYASTGNRIVSSSPSLPSKPIPQAIHYPLRQNKFQLRPPLHHLHTAFLSLCIFSSILIRNLTNCKSKESNHQGIKLQFKRTFKGFTFAKKLRQALHQTGSSENFSQTSILVRASSRFLSCAFASSLAL